MYGAVIKLDTLSDTDRTGTKYQYLFLWIGFDGFVLASEYGIVVRCGCLKLCGTGIYHLECCHDTIFITHVMDLFFGLSGQFCNNAVRELDAVCFF